MAFDTWGVLPGLEKDEFTLAEMGGAAGPAQPFMRESEPMSEEKIRAELKKREAPDTLVDIRIAKAKEEWKKSG